MHYLIGAITLIHCQYKIHTPGGFELASTTCPNPLFSPFSIFPFFPLCLFCFFFFFFTKSCTCNKFLRSFHALKRIIFSVFSSVCADCSFHLLSFRFMTCYSKLLKKHICIVLVGTLIGGILVYDAIVVLAVILDQVTSNDAWCGGRKNNI